MRKTLVRSLVLVAAGAVVVLQTSCRALWPTPQEEEIKQIAVLQSDAGIEQKAAACRELARVGTGAAVPALAALLADEKLNHMARFGLEPIPSAAVDRALRQAVARLSGRPLVGVIGSIGVRRDAAATQALVTRLQDPDPEVAQAAARALGSIGTPAAAAALEETLATCPAENQLALCEGLLRAAERFAAADPRARTGATAIYDRLRTLSPAPHQVRTAALRGAVLARQDAGIPLLVEALRGDSLALAEAAARTAIELPGPAVSTAFADELGKLPVARQVLVTSVLGRRGGTVGVSALLALAGGGDTVARVAAIRALGEIGDASAAPLMLSLHKDPEADVARAARDALAALTGPQVDDAVATMLTNPDPETRGVAIELLAQRRGAAAMPALLAASKDADETIRVKSIKLLGGMAGAAEFPALVDLLLTSKSTPTAEAAEAALSAVCTREARPAAGKVTIHKAIYGDLPSGPSSDVTDKVASLVKAGTFSVDATNANFGDPVQGKVKQLRIEYTVDGTTETRTVRENDTVLITAGAAPAPLTDALCVALAQASVDLKPAFLRALRSARGPKALATVRDATADANSTVRGEAVSVLCGWPTTEALPDVTQLAKTTTDARAKILAIRGAVRLIQMQTSLASAKLAALQEALTWCTRPEEKRLALAAVGAIPAPEALAVLGPFLGDPALKEDACLAAVAVAEKIVQSHRARVTEAMGQVVKATAAPETRKRAEALLAQPAQKPAGK